MERVGGVREVGVSCYGLKKVERKKRIILVKINEFPLMMIRMNTEILIKKEKTTNMT